MDRIIASPASPLSEDDEGEVETTSFTMTPYGNVIVTGFYERSVDGGEEFWETGIIVGVRAASCD